MAFVYNGATSEGRKIGELVIEKIGELTQDDFAKEDSYSEVLLKISEAIDTYVNNYYEYDVTTNGTSTQTVQPFATAPVTDHPVDGLIIPSKIAVNLRDLIKTQFDLQFPGGEISPPLSNPPTESERQDIIKSSWTSFLTGLLTWLIGWTTVTTGDGKTPPEFLVGPVGSGTVVWTFNPSSYAEKIMNDLWTEFREFDNSIMVDENDKIVQFTWDVVGTYIHEALEENQVLVPVDAGTPGPLIVAQPAVYVGTESGSLIYTDTAQTFSLSIEEAQSQAEEVEQEVLESKAQSAYDKEYQEAIDEGATEEEAEERAQAAYDAVIEEGL